MQTSHSPKPRSLRVDPLIVARACVLNGFPISAVTAAQLEARGINVGELEQRLRQNFEFVS